MRARVSSAKSAAGYPTWRVTLQNRTRTEPCAKFENRELLTLEPKQSVFEDRN